MQAANSSSSANNIGNNHPQIRKQGLQSKSNYPSGHNLMSQSQSVPNLGKNSKATQRKQDQIIGAGMNINSHLSQNLKNAQSIDKKLNNNFNMSDEQAISLNLNGKKTTKQSNRRDPSEQFNPAGTFNRGQANFRTPVGFSPDRITAFQGGVDDQLPPGPDFSMNGNGISIAQSSYMKKSNSKMGGFNQGMGSPMIQNQAQMMKGSNSMRNLAAQQQQNVIGNPNLRNSFNQQQQNPAMTPQFYGNQVKQSSKLLNSQSESKLKQPKDTHGTSTPAVGTTGHYRNQRSAIENNAFQNFNQGERQDTIKTPQIRGGLVPVPNVNININSSAKLQNNININIINHNIQVNNSKNNRVFNNSRENQFGLTAQNMIQQYQIGRQQIQPEGPAPRQKKQKINGLIIDHEESDVELLEYQNQLPDFKSGSKQSNSKAGRSPGVVPNDSVNKSNSQRRNIKSGNQNVPIGGNSQIWAQSQNQFQNDIANQQQPRSFIQNIGSQAQIQLANQAQQQSNYNIKKYNPNQPPVEIIQDQNLFSSSVQQINLLQNYNSAGSKGVPQQKPSGGVAYKNNQAHLFNPTKKSFKGSNNQNSLTQNNSDQVSNIINMNAMSQQMQQQIPQSYQQQKQQQQIVMQPQNMGPVKAMRSQGNQGSTGSLRRNDSNSRSLRGGQIISSPQAFGMNDNNQQIQDLGLQDPILKYAFKSRGGYIPNKPSKTNQDSYFIVKNFASIRNNWFFGVCDGHGINGHFASDHVKKFLPQNIEFIDYMAVKNKITPMIASNRTPQQKSGKAMGLASKNQSQSRGQSPNNSKNEEHNIDENSHDSQNFNFESQSYLMSQDKMKRLAILTEGFLKTSFDIRRRSFDCNYSGSTVVSVMISGQKLICANVGDSRAILGSLKSKSISLKHTESIAQSSNHEPNKIWVAQALSRDHKPDAKDEKERILACNGRVDTFREPNGDPIGPARVWLKHENVPGLAMSRSIGDFVASSVGVSPEPEFIEVDLNEDDKFIVIASDGVWEFIKNEEVVNMVVPFWLQNNPEGACDKLVKESVAHWKKEDEVIDDITCIVVFLNVKTN